MGELLDPLGDGIDWPRIEADLDEHGEPQDDADGEALAELRAALIAEGGDPDPEAGRLVAELEERRVVFDRRHGSEAEVIEEPEDG